jgi:hypothetical protein
MGSTNSTRLSADGQFWWDGHDWRQVSPDGRHYWDGSQWQPTGWNRPGVIATPKRPGRAGLGALIVVGTLLAATGAFLAASNVAKVPDAVSFLTAHKCAPSQAGSCYVEKTGTVAEIVSQVGLDPDQSMNGCTYRIAFDDGTTEPFPANCAALSSGDRVTGRFLERSTCPAYGQPGRFLQRFRRVLSHRRCISGSNHGRAAPDCCDCAVAFVAGPKVLGCIAAFEVRRVQPYSQVVLATRWLESTAARQPGLAQGVEP